MLSLMKDRVKMWFTKPFSYKSELALVLTCKFILLYGLWALCFSSPAVMPIDSDHVAHILLK
jgi:hypothetical protein